MSDEYISVHEIESNKQNSINQGVPVYQIQGLDHSDKGYIMKVGNLETLHDVLINEFKLLNKFKCYIVSRLFAEWEIHSIMKNPDKVYQMIKIIICKDSDEMNNPLSYLCFNFRVKNVLNEYISTDKNKIELTGEFTITFHFKEDNNNKYMLLKSYDTFIGKDSMLNKTIKCLFEENVLKVLDKYT